MIIILKFIIFYLVFKIMKLEKMCFYLIRALNMGLKIVQRMSLLCLN